MDENPESFTEILDECSGLIEASGAMAHARLPAVAEPLPSLLEQCRELTEQVGESVHPIHTIHHFACTGGTLISKCLASMPNTTLFSEVSPFSELGEMNKGFTPTDLILLTRNSSLERSQELESKIFLGGLTPIYGHCLSKGVRLILREHVHSQYCVDPAAMGRPTIRSVLSEQFPLRSVVSVRHPLDSFLSLMNNQWVQFSPGTVEEYAKRYHQFLDDYQDLPVFRYEDFVAEPPVVIEQLCEALELAFNSDFELLQSLFKLSGDSGRSGAMITPRKRRTVPPEIEQQCSVADSYRSLCERLGYEV